MSRGDNIRIPAVEIEFVEGSHTIWVHAPNGTTTLRIKCSGKINVSSSCFSPVAHGDIFVEGDIDVCLPGG